MNIVLIGASGFLGKSILSKIELYCPEARLSLLSSSVVESIAELRCSSALYRYRWPDDSLSDSRFLSLYESADVIIYAAGAGVQPMENPSDDSVGNLNLYEPVRIARVLDKIGYKNQFLTFGSYFELGNNSFDSPLSESEFENQFNHLSSLYGKTKKQLTVYHKIYQISEPTFSWAHLVLSNIYGPGENPNRLIPYIIKTALSGQALRFTSGKQMRQYTYIDDVVEIILSLLSKTRGIYNITNPKVLSVRDVISETIRQIKERYSIEPTIEFDLAIRRDTDMNYLAISAQKLQDKYGFSCTTSINEGISKYFEHGNY